MACSRKQIADGVMMAYPRHTFVNNDPEDGSHIEFTWQKCELCDGLPGERYKVSAVIMGEPNSEDERVDFDVCPDCMYYVAYGEFAPEYDELQAN